MAAAGAHRYWGLYFTGGFNSYGVYVREVELRTSVGGSDVTTPSTLTYANSTEGTNYPQNTVDNSTGTYWSSYPAPAPQRLWWDLQTPVAIAEVSVCPYGSSFGPSGARVQYSDDGSTWFDATNNFTIADNANWYTATVEQPSTPPDPDAPQKTTPTLSVSSLTWSNPTYVLADDAQRASVVKAETNSSILNLSWTDTLPANALLIGIVVKVKGYVSSTASGAYWMPSMGLPTITPTTTETLYTLGSASALPSGYTAASRPTSAMLLAYQNTSANTTHYINYISVELWWKLPGGGVNVLFIGEMF